MLWYVAALYIHDGGNFMAVRCKGTYKLYNVRCLIEQYPVAECMLLRL